MVVHQRISQHQCLDGRKEDSTREGPGVILINALVYENECMTTATKKVPVADVKYLGNLGILAMVLVVSRQRISVNNNNNTWYM